MEPATETPCPRAGRSRSTLRPAGPSSWTTTAAPRRGTTRVCPPRALRKLHHLPMALPVMAPGCCPLGKVTPYTPSSDQATFPFPSSTKALKTGSRTSSMPTPSLGCSDFEPRQQQPPRRGLSLLCMGAGQKPLRQLQQLSPRLPMDLSDLSLQLPLTARPRPPRPACRRPPAGAVWVAISSPGATYPSP